LVLTRKERDLRDPTQSRQLICTPSTRAGSWHRSPSQTPPLPLERAHFLVANCWGQFLFQSQSPHRGWCFLVVLQFEDCLHSKGSWILIEGIPRRVEIRGTKLHLHFLFTVLSTVRCYLPPGTWTRTTDGVSFENRRVDKIPRLIFS